MIICFRSWRLRDPETGGGEGEEGETGEEARTREEQRRLDEQEQVSTECTGVQ